MTNIIAKIQVKWKYQRFSCIRWELVASAMVRKRSVNDHCSFHVVFVYPWVLCVGEKSQMRFPTQAASSQKKTAHIRYVHVSHQALSCSVSFPKSWWRLLQNAGSFHPSCMISRSVKEKLPRRHFDKNIEFRIISTSTGVIQWNLMSQTYGRGFFVKFHPPHYNNKIAARWRAMLQNRHGITIPYFSSVSFMIDVHWNEETHVSLVHLYCVMWNRTYIKIASGYQNE